MTAWTIPAEDESVTERLAAGLAPFAVPGTVIGLSGTLGTGKTCFVRAFAQALGVPPDQVVSPTFVLCQCYDCSPPVYHYDAYRLSNADDFLALGTEEVLGQTGIAFIEWSDRVAAGLPDDRLEICIEDRGGTRRLLVFSALGPASQELLQRARRQWEAADRHG